MLKAEQKRETEREMRARIRLYRTGQESISRRLSELDMSLSQYVRLLIREDIGVRV